VISSAPGNRSLRRFVTRSHTIIHLSSSIPISIYLHLLRLNTPDISVLLNILSCNPFRYSTMKGLFVLLPLVAASPFSIGTIHKDVAPLLSSKNAEEVPNSYIVVFKKHVTHEAANKHHSWVQDIHCATQNTKAELRKRDQFPFQDTVFEGLRHTYNIAGNLLGYSGHFDDDVIEQVRRHPDVGLRHPFSRARAHVSTF
jgi:Peptidase inhibitor I9